VGHQWLGRYGKTDNGVVTVTALWADERLYYPVQAVPYTPARHFAKGKSDPRFRTKLATGAYLAARAAGFAFRTVAAARALAWHGPDDPGDWQAATRAFRDGRTQAWYAADATLGWWGTDGFTRLVVATADPGTLPDKATWYLARTCPGPAARARQIARTRRRTWPRSPGSTGSGTGSSRAISRSRTSWAGPTSRSAPISRSAATRPVSASTSPRRSRRG